MKNQLRKFQFTLVEVLIAMGICVVGVVSIMGLFPIGANATRDANMAFYADQAAEQMLYFTKYAVLNAKEKVTPDPTVPEDFYYRFSPAIFQKMTSGTEVGGGECDGWDLGDPDDPDTLSETGSYKIIAKPSADNEPKPTNDIIWSDLEDDTIIQDHLKSDEITSHMITMLTNAGTEIKVGVDTSTTPHKTLWNLYRLGFITKNGADDIEDFACVIRLWATPVYLPKESGETPVILPRIATFHIEVSWPADLPYIRRQKEEYSLDVFVPER
ncbi:MAG: hypothetical protein J5654_04850 [Victivallales bacterium]|nr:hypothetical protein [Victivallales bacterium]